MRRLLAQLFVRERQRRGLSVRDVAHVLGYSRKLTKGIKRIERFETNGTGSREFVQRLFAALDLDLESAEFQVIAAQRRGYEAWLRQWLIHHDLGPIAEAFIVRCFAGYYSKAALPSSIVTPSQAVEHVRTFAKSHGLEVCLPLTPFLSVYLDKQGRIAGIAGRRVVESHFPRLELCTDRVSKTKTQKHF